MRALARIARDAARARASPRVASAPAPALANARRSALGGVPVEKTSASAFSSARARATSWTSRWLARRGAPSAGVFPPPGLRRDDPASGGEGSTARRCEIGRPRSTPLVFFTHSQSSHHAAFAFVRLRRLIASSSRSARRQEPPGRDRRVRRDRRGRRRRRDRVHGDGPVLRRDREAPHRGRDQAGAFSSSPMRTFFTRPVGSTFDRVPFQLTDECTFPSIHPNYRFSPTRRSTFETAWKSPSSWLECASARISSR